MKPVWFALGVVLVGLAGWAGYWAAGVALESPDDPLAAEVERLVYVVEEGTVGRSLSFTASGEWDLVPLGLNGAAGVVTTVDVASGDEVGVGDVLFSVGLGPVVVAEGEIPMFRPLARGAEGPDVAQLQMMLAGLGFFGGEVDGEFGVGTRTAVKAWQDSLGVADSGIVGPGDVIFVSALPARVSLDSLLTVGARLGGGEQVIWLVPDAPGFQIGLAPEQASLVPLSADVRVHFAGGIWEAVITQAVERPERGQLDLILAGADGGPVCGAECGEWVGLDGRSLFRADIIVIPETTGPIVPVGAISTDAGNAPSVTLTDESLVPVVIVESANGLAVVDGLDPGTEILLPAAEE